MLRNEIRKEKCLDRNRDYFLMLIKLAYVCIVNKESDRRHQLNGQKLLSPMPKQLSMDINYPPPTNHSLPYMHEDHHTLLNPAMTARSSNVMAEENV